MAGAITTGSAGPGKGRRALITGASSGIGKALAEVFAREGWSLVLVARRTGPMEELAAKLAAAHGTEAVVIGADLGTREGLAKVAREVEARRLPIDALVNNAGFGLAGPFEKLPADEQLSMVDVNCTALAALSRAFLPGMIGRGSGYVLNVSSTAGFQPGPFMAVYYASKAFVTSFSEALAEECRGAGVSVTALCPGFTDTEFAARAAAHQKPRLFDGPLGTLDAAHVAELGYRAMLAGKRLVIPGLVNRVGAWSAPFTPRGLLLRLTRRMNQSA
jgi:hypothetical protein